MELNLCFEDINLDVKSLGSVVTIVVGGVLYLGHKKNKNYDERRKI